MADKIVTVAEFPDSAQATLAMQRLSDHGIKSVLTGENATNIYAGLPPISQVKLQTFETQAEQAKQILESREPESEEQ